MKRVLVIISCSLFMTMSSCKNEQSKTAAPEPVEQVLETKQGLASFYGRAFDGKKTSSGTIFNHRDMVAAHPVYPIGTLVRVTNLHNQDTVHVTITDRGPTKINRKEGVIIDISRGAAEKINMISRGRARVMVEVLSWGEDNEEVATNP